MKHFYVIGNPIQHSKSPQIHLAFAKQFNIPLDYTKLEVAHEPEDSFTKTINSLRLNNAVGCNVTLPFKENAFKIANFKTDRVLLAKAANTLHFSSNGIFADNTDGIGLVRDIENNLLHQIASKRILIIGAGGAAKGVMASLLQKSPYSLTIANRTANKAQQLASEFARHFSNINIIGLGLDSKLLYQDKFDIIINASSSSVDGTLPDVSASLYNEVELAYDMMYAKEATIFEINAKQNGAVATSDGLGMLVEQAAESFYIWHEKRPDTKPVLNMLLNQ